MGIVGDDAHIVPNKVPPRISIIDGQQLRDRDEVVGLYKQIKKLQTNNLENRGWLFDVLNCVNRIGQREFSLSDVYKYVDILQNKHEENHNVEAKIRQQLQLLRDKGFIEFLEKGKYRKIV